MFFSKPLIACFNGKSIWESFCREMLPGTYKKREFTFGRQDIAPIGGIKSVFYVMPSSSARCAAFPTSDTKLPWFREIKALKGIVINQSRARCKCSLKMHLEMSSPSSVSKVLVPVLRLLVSISDAC